MIARAKVPSLIFLCVCHALAMFGLFAAAHMMFLLRPR